MTLSKHPKIGMGSSQERTELDRKLLKKELSPLQARDKELDGLFERIYEDNVSGKLSDERFDKMSRRYEDEQKEISEKVKLLGSELDKLGSKAMTSDAFLSIVRRYTRAKKLTIHYNCVGGYLHPGYGFSADPGRDRQYPQGCVRNLRPAKHRCLGTKLHALCGAPRKQADASPA